MLVKYFAIGNTVVINGKKIGHGKELPKRPPGFYDALVDNGLAKEVKAKEKYSASAKNKAPRYEAAINGETLQGMPEEWGGKPQVSINTKRGKRGKK